MITDLSNNSLDLDNVFLFEKLKHDILERKSILHLTGKLQLTKNPTVFYDEIVMRDFDLERETLTWFNSRLGASRLFEIWSEFDKDALNLSLPVHIPVRCLFPHSLLKKGDSVFVFFPYALNLSTEDLSDHFSIELIDVSKRIFFSNVLINSEKFISNFYLWKKLLIDERKFERCIYLYSLFHENAHCLGPWKEMPSKDPRMKVKYNSWNIFSEMSADLFTILGLKDFPEVVILILITRIFWYGARDNTVFDSDTTLSVCLWNCLVESGGITLNSNKTFAINFNQSIQTIKSLLKEILDLGNTVITLEKDPDDHLEIWLQKNCGWNGISHSLPQSLKSFYC